MDIVLVELFAGIGGFHEGFKRAGFNITKCYFSEIDIHSIAVYKYKFPHAEYIGSVADVSGREIRSKHLGATIIVTGGFPCQDISIAGKRKGVELGTRSGLFFELARIIAECWCQYFIAENVKGLSSIDKGRTFHEVLNVLSTPGEGGTQYNVDMQLLNTSWLLPQNRERFYFVGSIATISRPQVFPITENDFRATKRAGNAATVRTLTGGGNSGGMHSSMTLLRV